MPWNLKPPRAPWTPYWYVRGTYCGIKLNRSTGTSERRAAARILATWKEQAERGEFAKPPIVTSGPVDFATAALAYMKAGGERTFLEPILKAWGERPLDTIDQVAIDTLAEQLYPNASPATRNRQCYTPVSAVLRHVGKGFEIRRPHGAQGRRMTSWLQPEEAFRLFEAAQELDHELWAL